MWEDALSSEGWALYSEQLIGEPREGFPEGFYTPEERLFQLQNQLLRDARVVVDRASTAASCPSTRPWHTSRATCSS